MIKKISYCCFALSALICFVLLTGPTKARAVAFCAHHNAATAEIQAPDAFDSFSQPLESAGFVNEQGGARSNVNFQRILCNPKFHKSLIASHALASSNLQEHFARHALHKHSEARYCIVYRQIII